MPFMSSGVRMMECGALLEPSPRGGLWWAKVLRESPIFVNDEKATLSSHDNVVLRASLGRHGQDQVR